MITSKVLVAYLSVSGVTTKLVKLSADTIGANLHEIWSEKPHSNVDSDWMNKKSCSGVEMNDKSFRPAVANKAENMEQYSQAFVGSPIWWCVAPMIINTLLEQYDLTGKKATPFVTSGSSGMGNTNAESTEFCEGAVLCDGKRSNTDVKATELKVWAEDF